MQHSHRRRPSARIWLGLMAALMLGGAMPLAAQAQPAANGPVRNGQQQQPSRGETDGRLRQQGDAPAAQQSERELRDLNALSRQLLPPGSEVPAPEVEPGPAGRR